MTLLDRIKNYLFFIIVFSIPLNLGKHYILEVSYVNGKLIDYLIPTIFIQDILITLLLLISLTSLLKKLSEIFMSGSALLVFLSLFLVSLFFSVIGSKALIPSIYAFLRIILYAGFGFYVISNRNFEEDYSILFRIFSMLLFGLGLLGLAQWINQGSVFNNYLFFGEQPYSFSTPNIVRESLFGFTRIPPYGTFRHPNIFAAFLSFALLILFPKIFKDEFSWFNWLCFGLGLLNLVLTFSWLVLFSFILSSLILFIFFYSDFKFFNKAKDSKLKYIPLLYLIFSVAITIALFVFPSRFPHPSLSYRRNLLLIGFNLLKNHPLFGIGLNNFTLFVDSIAINLGLPKFTQPIHNVYVLFLVESGIFSFLFLLLFLYKLLMKMLQFLSRSSNNRELLFILLLHLLFLGIFDHFLVTSHQMFLAFWLTLGFCLQYNLT